MSISVMEALQDQLLQKAEDLERSGELAGAVTLNRRALLMDPLHAAAPGILHGLYQRLGRLGDDAAAWKVLNRELLCLAGHPGGFYIETYRAMFCLAQEYSKQGQHQEALQCWRQLLSDETVQDGWRQRVLGAALRDALRGDDREFENEVFELYKKEFPPSAEFLAYGMLHLARETGNEFWENRDLLGSIATFDLVAELGFEPFDRLNREIMEDVEVCGDWAANYSSPGAVSRRTSMAKLLTANTPTMKAFRNLLHDKARIYLQNNSRYVRSLAGNEARLGFSRFVGLKIKSVGECESHIQGGNVLSGVYYPHVPNSVSNQSDCGHIEFGRPDIAYSGPMPPTITLRPRNGLLLLFPAYLFHRILPGDFGEERFSIALDFNTL